MALPAVDDPTGLFNKEIKETDLAGQTLDQLFGENWEKLAQVVDGTTGSEAASLMLTLLQAMSTVALSIGSVIMVYTIFVGVIGTAHEGKPMGEKLSTLWTPIRGALSVAMLIPTAKGLNILMVIILACVAGSVSFANYLTDKSYDFLRSSGGQIAVSAPPAMRSNIEEVSQLSLKVLASQHFMAYKGGHTFSDGMWSVYPPSGEGNYYAVVFNNSDQSRSSRSDMGSIQVPCYKEGGDDICRARTNAIQQLLGDLVPEARNMAVSVMTEKEIQAAGAPSYRDVDGGAILGAVDNYVSTIAPYISQIIKDSDPKFQEDLEGFVEESKKSGWFMLGSYYWTLARISEHTHELSGNLPTTTQANIDALMSNMWNDPAFGALWKTSEEATKEVLDGQMNAARAGGGAGIWAGFRELFNKNIGDNGAGFVSKQLLSGDPILTLSNFGHYVTNIGLGVLTLAHGADVGMTAAAAGADNIVVNALTLGAAKAATKGGAEIAGKVAAAATVVCSALILFGLFAAFYLPALPWILWMGAMIGWLILIVETLFAAPLWAVGHLIPEGDGFAGQHGRQGYMLMLGILARPPLMVAGFFASIIIFTAIGKGVGASLMVYQASVTANWVAGPITFIAFVILLISVMIVFAHKVFGLITHLPENVTKWIGGQATSLGEHQDESRIRGMAVVAGRGGTSAVGGAAGAMKAGDDGPSGGGSGSGGGRGGSGGGVTQDALRMK